MKKILFLLLTLLFVSYSSFSQEYEDVVYLKNGSIIRGVIIEQVPNESLKIKTSGGSIFVYKMDEVEKMVKEEKVSESSTTNAEYSNYDLGGILIAWFGGTVWYGDFEVDKQTNIFAHIFIDYYIVEKFAVGAYINKSLNSAFEDETGEKDNMFEFGMSLKPRFKVNEQFFVKPGLNLGYRIHSGPDVPDDMKVRGFGINFTLEGQYIINENSRFSGEFGFLSQPTGGSDNFDFTYAPILMLGFGYTYSF